MAVWLAGCGGGGGDTVATGYAPVTLSFTVPAKAAKNVALMEEDTGSTDSLFYASGRSLAELLVPTANAAPPPAGVTLVVVTISGPGMNSIVDNIPITPGVAVTRTYNVPIGPNRSFIIRAFDAAGVMLFQGTQVIANLQAGTPVVLNIPMIPTQPIPPTPGGVMGTVLDAATNQPIAGATVDARAGANVTQGPIAGSAVTTAGGAYTINNLAPGTYTLTANATGYTQATVVVVVTAGVTTNVAAILLQAQQAPPPPPPPPPATGGVTGSVVDAATNLPIAGASVSAREIVNGIPGPVIATATTGAGGTYTINNLPAGTYRLTATAAGYIQAGVTVTVTGGATANAPVIQLQPQQAPPPPPPATGGVTGSVVDATTNQPVGGATVDARAGANVTQGPIAASATTGATGTFTINNLAAGTYTLTVTANGYAQASATVVITAGATANANVIPLSPLQAAGQTRIVLRWGTTPADLDSHLIGPYPQAGSFHVYYANRGSATAPPFAVLDVDVTTGRGPETITITQQSNGTYSYYVYDFTNGGIATSTALSNSGATVTVYQGAQVAPVAVFNVPANFPGDAWHVFDMDGATSVITPVNTIQTAGTSFVRVLVNPANPLVRPGTQTQFSALKETVKNTTSPVTGATWSSNNQAVATINAQGLSANLANGTAIITATDPVSGISGSTLLTVDGIAPTVVSHTPAANATAVPVTSTVSATFSEPVDPATVTTTSFAVTPIFNGIPQAPIAGTLSFDPTGTIVTFTPQANLQPFTGYVVTLTPAITDLAGNPLAAAPFSWNFTTQ